MFSSRTSPRTLLPILPHAPGLLPRVINFKFLLQPHQKYYITQYEELGFSHPRRPRGRSVCRRFRSPQFPARPMIWVSEDGFFIALNSDEKLLYCHNSCYLNTFELGSDGSNQGRATRNGAKPAGSAHHMRTTCIFPWLVSTLSLPRVINVKLLLQPHQKYYITQYGELVFS